MKILKFLKQVKNIAEVIILVVLSCFIPSDAGDEQYFT